MNTSCGGYAPRYCSRLCFALAMCVISATGVARASQDTPDPLFDRINEQITDHALKTSDGTRKTFIGNVGAYPAWIVWTAHETYEAPESSWLPAIKAHDHDFLSSSDLSSSFNIPWSHIVGVDVAEGGASFFVRLSLQGVSVNQTKSLTTVDVTVDSIDAQGKNYKFSDSSTVTKVSEATIPFSTLTEANKLRDLLRTAVKKYGRKAVVAVVARAKPPTHPSAKKTAKGRANARKAHNSLKHEPNSKTSKG